ncbi:MAG: cytochrome c, partial [Paracoccaceae bacterium]|nr:cytochrome c [Paracoccaceae bacterium]
MSKSLSIGSVVVTAAVLTTAYNFADRWVIDMPVNPDAMTVAFDPQPTTPVAQPVAMAGAAYAADMPPSGPLGLGRVALPDEIAAWDIDIRPDGLGLPVGSGDVMTGEEVFTDNCAMCHGDFGEAVGRWPVLAGGSDTLDSDDPVKTIGSYWPYLSTVWDYVHRAMPFGNAQSLSDDEVYAITAYLLYLNDIVDEEFELSNENFLAVPMENEPNFYPDDRMETEIPAFTREVCMDNCKPEVSIT